MDSMDGSGGSAYRMFPRVVMARFLSTTFTKPTPRPHITLFSCRYADSGKVGGLTRAIRYRTLHSVLCNMVWTFPPARSDTAKNGILKCSRTVRRRCAATACTTVCKVVRAHQRCFVPTLLCRHNSCCSAEIRGIRSVLASSLRIVARRSSSSAARPQASSPFSSTMTIATITPPSTWAPPCVERGATRTKVRTCDLPLSSSSAAF